MSKPDEKVEEYRIPVNAFTGGIGYRYVLGSCAEFPWNDFSRSDTRSEIAFEIEPCNGWGGDKMGVRIMNALDEFANDKARAKGGKHAVSFKREKCSHGTSIVFSHGKKHLFTLEPKANWQGDELADYIAEAISGLVKKEA